MKSSQISMAAQLGFELGRNNYINSSYKKLLFVRDEFAILALEKKGIYKTPSTISAFVEGYNQGWLSEKSVCNQDTGSMQR